MSVSFQEMESLLGSAIQKANQVLDASANGDAIPADVLQRAADELHKTVESVASAGLGESHPLAQEAAQLRKSLRNKATNQIKVCGACGLNI